MTSVEIELQKVGFVLFARVEELMSGLPSAEKGRVVAVMYTTRIEAQARTTISNFLCFEQMSQL